MLDGLDNSGFDRMREAISIKKDQHDGTEHRSVTTSSFKLRLENEENPSETARLL